MKLAEIFGDHMVIQRRKPFVIWGTGEEGEKIRVRIGDMDAETVVENGTWKAELPPMEARSGLRVVVESDRNSRILEDVAAGEVWLAGGQSNMEFYMLYDAGYEEELKCCSCPELRFFDYPEVSYPEQKQDFDYSEMGFWRKCTAEDLKYYSAAAYYFGRKLQKDLNVPVGIIGCNWGGTTASCWMSEEYLRRSGEIWIRDYEEQASRISDMDAYTRMFRKHPVNDKGRPFEDPFLRKMMSPTTREEQLEMMQNMSGDYQQLINSPLDPNRPCGLYHTMLEQVAPFPIQGVIWYQGESDSCHADIYGKVFLDMAACWRNLWKEKLPFLTVQLAPFEVWLTESGERFPEIRRQQRMAAEEEGIYLVSISDAGERYDIHPKRKKPAGERLALMAEEKMYGFHVTADAPEGISARNTEDGFEICFANAGNGLRISGERMNALEIQGSDGTVLPVISCRAEKERLYVRVGKPVRESCRILFAQTPYYEVNLYNSSGIPAIPFVLETEK